MMEEKNFFRKQNSKMEEPNNEFMEKKVFQEGLYQNNLKIKSIQGNIDLYDKKIEALKYNLEKISADHKVQEKCLKETQQQVTKNQKEERSNARFKSITSDTKKLENNLEKKQKKISKVKSENEQLRFLIDNLRKEKNIYRNICENVEKEIEMLNKNYDQANRKLTKLENHKKNIQSKLQKDEKEHEKEEYLATLGYITMKNQLKSKKILVPNEIRTKNDMIKEISQNQNMGNNQLFTKTNNNPDSSNLYSIPYSPRTPGKKVVNVTKTRKEKEEDFQNEERELKDKLSEYKTLHEELLRLTDTKNLNEFLVFFQNLEEENQDSYKENKLLIENINDLKDQKLSMQLELKEMMGSQQNKESMKENIVAEMKNDLKKIDENIKIVQNKKQKIKKEVQTLKLSIPVILERLNVKNDKFQKTLDNQSNHEVKENPDNFDIQNYLEKLEKRTNEILKMIKDNQLQSRIFEEMPNKNQKLKQEKLTKNHFFNIEEIKSKISRIP